MSKLLPLSAVLLILAGTAACGRMADLEAPERRTERGMRSGNAEDLPEPATINRPNSQLPIDGGPSSPYGGSGATPGQG